MIFKSTSSNVNNNQQIRSITPVSGNTSSTSTPPPPVPQMSKPNSDVNIHYQKSTNQVPQPQHPVKSATACQQIKAEPPQSQIYSNSNSQFSQANNRIFQYHQQTPYYSTTTQQSSQSQYNSSSDNLNYNSRNQTNSPTFNNTNTNPNNSIGDNKDSSNSSISPKTSLSQFAVKKQVSLSSLNQSPLTNGFPTQSQQQYPSYVNCYQSPPAQTNHTPICPPNPSPQSLSGSSTSSTPVPTSLLSQQQQIQHLTPPRDQLAPPSTSSSSSSNNTVQEMFQVVETSSSTSSNLICKSIFTETNLEELFYIYPAVHELILSQTMMGSSIEQIVQELKASLEQHQKQQQHFSIRT